MSEEDETTLEEDVERIEAVRASVGHDVRVMIDANQSFTHAEALRRGYVYQEYDLEWFEEPLPAHDHEGLTDLAYALTLPIATGENEYGKAAFKDLLVQKGVDIVQADLRRAGGATEILEIGVLAAAFGKPYASHGGSATDLHLLACIPTAAYAELGLLGPTSRIRLEDGCALVPNGPGFAWE